MLQGLDCDSKAALAIIYIRNGQIESPILLEELEHRPLQRLGSTLAGCITGLEALNGSLVQYANADGITVWRLKHPTVGDAFASLLSGNPEWLEIYLHGSLVEDLIEQVTCGNVGLEKAVVIPRSLFPLIMRRLDEFSMSTKYKSPVFASYTARSRIMYFLARRCSKEFLRFYIEKNPQVLDRVANPGLMLSAVSEVDLAARLHKARSPARPAAPKVHRND